MSAFIQYATPMIYENAIIQALCELGFSKEQIEYSKEPIPLIGYEGYSREEKANIIIRKKYVGTASNDIGFYKTDAGYQFIISDYDQSRFNQAWRNKLEKAYQKHAHIYKSQLSGFEEREAQRELERLIVFQKQQIYKEAKKRGYQVTESKIDGKIRLVLVKK